MTKGLYRMTRENEEHVIEKAKMTGGDLIAVIFHLIAVVAAGVALTQLIQLADATSAPQQAAVAAMAAATAIIPYCMARAVSEIVRHGQGR
jgi:hypothetical protein